MNKFLNDFSKKLRKNILFAANNSGEASHIGGSLSIVEILSCLYGKILKKEKKSIFILSKGHAFMALLSCLYLVNKVSKKEFLSFQTNGSEFIAHPIMNVKKGIESSNGSLGQGLSFAVGIALAKKKKREKGNVYVLIGDGECYEGSIWEAAITASENDLNNLIVILDSNGFQNDGEISKKMSAYNLKKKWRGFDWEVENCNGHDFEKLLKGIKNTKINKPKILIAKTIKGKGVKFMENNNDWHHGRLTEKLYNKAIAGL